MKIFCFWLLMDRQMDDNTKIRALMIYYDHWGKEELRAQKTLRGLEETMRMLDEFDVQALMESFYDVCEQEDIHFLWTEISQLFLRNCGGCLDPIMGDDFYDEQELLFTRNLRLMGNLNISFSELIEQEFEYQDALSVDAIVALL